MNSDQTRCPDTQRRLNSGHPRWWAVLSVAIALMALVAAISGSRSHVDPQKPQGPTSLRNAIHRSRSPVVIHEPPSRTSTSMSVPSIAEEPSVVPSTVPVESTTSPPAEIATSPHVPAPVVDLSPVGSFEGFFESPWVVSADYPTAISSNLTATATWSGLVTMTLALSCSVSNQSKTGSSGISLSYSGLSSGCVVSLSEPFATAGVSDYTIEVST